MLGCRSSAPRGWEFIRKLRLNGCECFLLTGPIRRRRRSANWATKLLRSQPRCRKLTSGCCACGPKTANRTEMALPFVQLLRDMFSGENRRPSIALLTSSICLAAWYWLGNQRFWAEYLSGQTYVPRDSAITPAVAALIASVTLLGIVPLLVVKF